MSDTFEALHGSPLLAYTYGRSQGMSGNGFIGPSLHYSYNGGVESMGGMSPDKLGIPGPSSVAMEHQLGWKHHEEPHYHDDKKELGELGKAGVAERVLLFRLAATTKSQVPIVEPTAEQAPASVVTRERAMSNGRPGFLARLGLALAAEPARAAQPTVAPRTKIVTTTRQIAFGEVAPDSDSNEPALVLAYHALTRNYSQTTEQKELMRTIHDSSGRPSSPAHFMRVLPESRAREFFDRLQADPGLVRPFARDILDELGITDGSRLVVKEPLPDYSKWPGLGMTNVSFDNYTQEPMLRRILPIPDNS